MAGVRSYNNLVSDELADLEPVVERQVYDRNGMRINSLLIPIFLTDEFYDSIHGFSYSSVNEILKIVTIPRPGYGSSTTIIETQKVPGKENLYPELNLLNNSLSRRCSIVQEEQRELDREQGMQVEQMEVQTPIHAEGLMARGQNVYLRTENSGFAFVQPSPEVNPYTTGARSERALRDDLRDALDEEYTEEEEDQEEELIFQTGNRFNT